MSAIQKLSMDFPGFQPIYFKFSQPSIFDQSNHANSPSMTHVKSRIVLYISLYFDNFWYVWWWFNGEIHILQGHSPRCVFEAHVLLEPTCYLHSVAVTPLGGAEIMAGHPGTIVAKTKTATEGSDLTCLDTGNFPDDFRGGNGKTQNIFDIFAHPRCFLVSKHWIFQLPRYLHPIQAVCCEHGWLLR